MIAICLCFLFPVLVLVFLLYCVYDPQWAENARKDFRSIVVMTLFAALLVAAGCAAIVDNRERPSALDVYRGRTALEITYRDSIPVDTVVIFKNDLK